MTYETVAEEIRDEGKSKVAERYRIAYLNEWTGGHKQYLINHFPSYRMGYLDYCGEQDMDPVLLD